MSVIKKPAEHRSAPLRSVYLRFLRSKSSRAGVMLICGFSIFILLAPYFLPYSPTQASGFPNSSPSLNHPFGTDYLGKDILSQVVYGAYPSLFVGLLSATGAVILGYLLGLMSGYYRRLEGIFSGITDIVMGFPSLVLLVIVGTLFLVSNGLIIASLILILWAPCARAIRAQTKSLKNKPFVEVARISGLSDWKILWRILAPEVISIAMAYFVIIVSISIVLVTALEFLGVGNPNQVSWGSILYFAQQYAFYFGDWWWVLAPGLSIALVSIGFALIGYSFEEVMNPRLRAW